MPSARASTLKALSPTTARAIALSPDYALAYYNRAWAHYLAGRNAEALTDIDRAIDARRPFGERLQRARPDPRAARRPRRCDRRFPQGGRARSRVPAAGGGLEAAWRRNRNADRALEQRARAASHRHRPHRAAHRRGRAVHGKHGLDGDRDLAAGDRARASAPIRWRSSLPSPPTCSRSPSASRRAAGPPTASARATCSAPPSPCS